mmetsp:Transcript_81176/g.169551  ORF Transcript_81176/g.169551 Transcript_81176/m.169551 type:complete len:213 (+) Transcript_81176:2302-2940(+)
MLVDGVEGCLQLLHLFHHHLGLFSVMCRPLLRCFQLLLQREDLLFFGLEQGCLFGMHFGALLKQGGDFLHFLGVLVLRFLRQLRPCSLHLQVVSEPLGLCRGLFCDLLPVVSFLHQNSLGLRACLIAGSCFHLCSLLPQSLDLLRHRRAALLEAPHSLGGLEASLLQLLPKSGLLFLLLLQLLPQALAAALLLLQLRLQERRGGSLLLQRPL